MPWAAAIALLLVAAAAPYGPLIALALLAGGYYSSIHLHPYANCEVCKGRGRNHGSVFTYGFRPCHKCSGTGRKQRWGAGAGRMNVGQARQPGKRWH